ADDPIGPVPVVLGLGDAHRCLEILVGESRVENFMALQSQVAGLGPARYGLPAVQEEDFHEVVVACCGRPGPAYLSPAEYQRGACPGGSSSCKMTRCGPTTHRGFFSDNES